MVSRAGDDSTPNPQNPKPSLQITQELASAGPSAISAWAPEPGDPPISAEIAGPDGGRVLVPIYGCALFAESAPQAVLRDLRDSGLHQAKLIHGVDSLLSDGGRTLLSGTCSPRIKLSRGPAAGGGEP
jgi:hypothetical protein